MCYYLYMHNKTEIIAKCLRARFRTSMILLRGLGKKDIDLLIVSDDFGGYPMISRQRMVDSLGINNLDCICLTNQEYSDISGREMFPDEKFKAL